MSNLNETIKWARDLAYGDFCDMSFAEAQRYENIANWLEAYQDILNSLEQISALYEDCENGAEDDIVLGWNRAIDRVREIIKEGVVDG